LTVGGERGVGRGIFERERGSKNIAHKKGGGKDWEL